MKKTKEINNKKCVGADASVCPILGKTQNNGITLIALIITIIVMLILVSVTVNMAINGGLFEKAGEAVGKMQNAIDIEQELINEIYNLADGNVNETPGSGGAGEGGISVYADAPKDSQGFLTENAKYETAVVPKGFKVVPGIENTTSVADGLVIQDKDGNEFVWIPVTFEVAEGSTKDANELYPEFLAAFYRSAWENNARTSTLTSTSFPSSSYDTWSDYTEPYASGYTTPEGKNESADYYEMMRSVQENKGFYIGRYEAGSNVPRTNKANGTTQMVVKRDAYPYNYVSWGLTMSNYTDDVTDQNSKNQGKGALYLSKHMYDGKDIGATSTLCYGIQWDAMLDFIKNSSHNVTSSKDWGNHFDNLWTISRTDAKFSTDNGKTWIQVPAKGKQKTSESEILLTTGASDSFAAKNIYDVAGNVIECINEALSSDYRVSRGGGYDGAGHIVPASDRGSGKTYYCNDFKGFRPALYIKNS